VSTQWLKQDHLNFLQRLLPYLEDRADQRLARELIYGLAQYLSLAIQSQASAAMMGESEDPVQTTDLDELNALVAKGVMHNGLVPDLSAVQVGRALRVLSQLLGRAAVSSLPVEDQEGLAWVFSVAASADDGVNREAVRRLERVVRAGLGLEYVLTDYEPVNQEYPA
jgi:hypothetical protein